MYVYANACVEWVSTDRASVADSGTVCYVEPWTTQCSSHATTPLRDPVGHVWVEIYDAYGGVERMEEESRISLQIDRVAAMQQGSTALRPRTARLSL